MPKKSTKSSATLSSDSVVPAENVSAPVTLSLIDSAVVTEPKAKKVRAPKAAKVAAPVDVDQSVQIDVVEPSVPVGDSAVIESEFSLTEQSVEFLSKLQQLSVLFNALKTDFKGLEKKWSREMKVAQKASSKRKRKVGNRAPSGFVKPTKISDELATFLGKESGSEMARTDVTREINTYIRANKLQDTSNGRKINPDKKLADLLRLKTTDELTYFNLQRYMSPHFAKNVAVKEEVVSTV